MTPLYERLGGAPAFEALVEDLYRRLLQDETLRPYFDGVDMERLKRHQRAFLTTAFGGPQEYSGRTLEAAHARFDITDEAFDRVAGHLVAALAGLGVPEEQIKEVAAAVLPLRPAIVQSSASDRS